MKGKILIGLLLMFLIIGTACAVNLSDLKVPIGYNEETDGFYYLNTDEDSHLYVGEMELNENVFENDTGYAVISLGNNTYFYCDSVMESTGVQEKVNIDGTDYLVSFYKDNFVGSLQDTEIKMFLEDLKDFNEKNNLKPLEV